MARVRCSLALATGCLLALASCGGGSRNSLSPRPDFLFIKSDNIGSYYLAGSAWSRIIRNHTDLIPVNTTLPATENEKIVQLAEGKVDVAFLKGPEAYLAYSGDPAYWREPQPIRALFSLWPSVYSLIAHGDSGINSIADIRGKRVALYSERSVTGDLFERLLGLHGIDRGNTRIVRVRDSIGIRMLKMRQVDCAWYDLGYGDYRLNKLFVTYPVSEDLSINRGGESYILVPCLPSSQLKEFLKVYPFFTVQEHGSEIGLGDAPQLTTASFAAASAAMPERLAGELTALWWENLDVVRQYVPDDLIRRADTRDNRRGVPVPFHPGALAWLKGAGLIEPLPLSPPSAGTPPEAPSSSRK